MERKEIRQFGGRIVGYYEIDGSGNKTVKDFYGKILGYYDASRDYTMDFYRKIFAVGDVTGIFFKDDIKM